jgi:hypothetical protein
VYNDGSGRTLSQRIVFTNPPADEYYTTPTYYSASAGSVCGVSTLTNYITFRYPFTVGAYVVYQDGSGEVPNGYYRMFQDPNVIYQVSSGFISGITNC